MMAGSMMSPMMGRGALFALPPGNREAADAGGKEVGAIVANYANQIQQRP
jgi:hypothetical protein